MKNNNVNSWNLFSRCVFVVLLAIAAFCGICGFGAKFNQIPWFRIAVIICVILIFAFIIWLFGLMSRNPVPSKGKFETNKNEAIDSKHVGESKENSNRNCRKFFDYDEHTPKEKNIDVPLWVNLPPSAGCGAKIHLVQVLGGFILHIS